MKITLVLFICIFAFIHENFAQSNKELISEIDKIVLDIKSNINSYRKIISENDSMMAENNTKHNLYETAYKKGNELVLIQYYNSLGNLEFMNYYFSKGQLICIEGSNRDKNNSKSYINNNRYIAIYSNGNEIDKNSVDFI